MADDEKKEGALIELAHKTIGSLHITAKENPKTGKKFGQISRESTDKDGNKRWHNIALFTKDNAKEVLTAIKECFEFIQKKDDEK